MGGSQNRDGLRSSVVPLLVGQCCAVYRGRLGWERYGSITRTSTVDVDAGMFNVEEDVLFFILTSRPHCLKNHAFSVLYLAGSTNSVCRPSASFRIGNGANHLIVNDQGRNKLHDLQNGDILPQTCPTSRPKLTQSAGVFEE